MTKFCCVAPHRLWAATGGVIRSIEHASSHRGTVIPGLCKGLLRTNNQSIKSNNKSMQQQTLRNKNTMTQNKTISYSCSVHMCSRAKVGTLPVIKFKAATTKPGCSWESNLGSMRHFHTYILVLTFHWALLTSAVLANGHRVHTTQEKVSTT